MQLLSLKLFRWDRSFSIPCFSFSVALIFPSTVVLCKHSFVQLSYRKFNSEALSLLRMQQECPSTNTLCVISLQDYSYMTEDQEQKAMVDSASLRNSGEQSLAFVGKKIIRRPSMGLKKANSLVQITDGYTCHH